MEHDVGVGFKASSNAFVLFKHWRKLCLQTSTVLASREKRSHFTVIIIVKHWYISLTAPAP